MRDEPYDFLAEIYDHYQSGIDASAWADYIDELIRRFGPRKGDGKDGKLLICDLGCGTGTVDRKLLAKGYDVIGIDASVAMLEKAGDLDATGEILYLCQDITRMELFGTVDVFLCLLDTVNHIVAPAALDRMLASFKNFLNPGGLFIFDTGTKTHFTATLGNRFFHAVFDDYALFWQNRFRENSQISTSDIVLFREGEDGRYDRSDIRIREKFYDAKTIRAHLRRAGLITEAHFGYLSDRKPGSRSDREFWVARRPFPES